MRITGGVLKGRIMKCPDGIIRPAMDRMRESVFAVLGDLSGKSWLDLFSGSGTVKRGFECGTLRERQSKSKDRFGKCSGGAEGMWRKNTVPFYACGIFSKKM